MNLLSFIMVPRILKAARPIDTLDTAIRDLLHRGLDAGVLFIRFSYTGKALEIRKYINSPDDYGIMLCFPKRRWTRKHFDEVESLCKQLDLDYMITSATFGRARLFEYIIADFGRNLSAAYRCVRTILVDIIKLDVDAKVCAYFHGASIRDELITSPDAGSLKMRRPRSHDIHTGEFMFESPDGQGNQSEWLHGKKLAARIIFAGLCALVALLLFTGSC